MEVSPSCFAFDKKEGGGAMAGGCHEPSISSGLAGVTCRPLHCGADGGKRSEPRSGDDDRADSERVGVGTGKEGG